MRLFKTNGFFEVQKIRKKLEMQKAANNVQKKKKNCTQKEAQRGQTKNMYSKKENKMKTMDKKTNQGTRRETKGGSEKVQKKGDKMRC